MTDMTQNNALTQPLQNQPIGFVSGGGLEANLQVRLTVPAQEVQSGAFVVMDSGNWRFYGLVTDLQLGAVDLQYANQLNINRFDPALAALLNQQTLFTILAVMPSLMREIGPEPDSSEYKVWAKENQLQSKLMPVKTVPDHHTPVRLADKADIAEIFGEESKTVFRVGETREQGHGVCLDLEKFVQRSSGIFGTTGSGKSFLARMILAGLIHADKASTLIFDMHNEYGVDSSSSDTNAPVAGLKGKFGSKVRLVGLGADSNFRDRQPDFTLEIAHSDIMPEDVLLLSETLNLTDVSNVTLDALYHKFGDRWFTAFKDMKIGAGAYENDENGKQVPAEGSVAAWANEVGVHVKSAEALRRKLGVLMNRKYLVAEPASNALDNIINNLQEGRHVVLSFGQYEEDIDYLLVTNLITRKVRKTWEEATNKLHSIAKNTGKPRPLVIAVEEAHKLLNREMANQTIFSTIAREMRKYYVTLLIIDQRPSQIYDEVMSQLGTRISASLGDEDDINAVLSGLPGRSGLRGMLAKLQPKEEVLMLGWGVPMPIPIRSRRYDQLFWKELLGDEGKKVTTPEDAKRNLGF